MPQQALFEREFQTARPPRPVYCHQDFLGKLAERKNEPVGKRAALLLQRMAVDISRLHYKGTSGVNRGWRRSRLGGTSGSHFYAWWAPGTAAPFNYDGLAAEPEAILLRDIRHHDDHAPLKGGDFGKDYLLLTVPDLRGTEYAPEPWTSPQAHFVRGRGHVKILKGHPGSGKTTALLHAADSSGAARVLYLTFSHDLAALARDYFDRFCSSQTRTFTVLPYAAFLSELLGDHTGAPDRFAARSQFRRDLGHHKQSLGMWYGHLDALYDEMHAHLIGAAVPKAAGRFPEAEHLRLPDAAYRAQRAKALGSALEGVLDAARRLERSSPEQPLADRYFPELALAWRAASALTSSSSNIESSFFDYDCIAVDEVQDLTPLEAFIIVSLAARCRKKCGHNSSLLLAGDEAQTVRPTDFEWAWLNDMLFSLTAHPQEFKLGVNLRSPRCIAEVVNRVWDLYDYLHKADRPSGTSYADIDDDSPDGVLYATVGQLELPSLLQSLSTREGLALIAFSKDNLPKDMLPFVLSPAEAKGLDFQSVCVLNGGSLLGRVVSARAAEPIDALTRRLAIDQLRVALSRPTERLLWVDVTPDPAIVKEVGRLLRPAHEEALHPVTAEALQICLNEEEDQLDIEDRLGRCQKDARQLLPVKPDLAWSRAQQALRLLGLPGDLNRITDRATNEATYGMLAEVAFQLAFRKIHLSPELGRLDLYAQSADALRHCGKPLLSSAIRAIGVVEQTRSSSAVSEHLNEVVTCIETITAARDQLPSWLVLEITPRAQSWLDELNRHLEWRNNAMIAQQILPPFFDALGLPDAQTRKDRLAQRAVQILIKNRLHADALKILEQLPQGNPKLTAECYEETNQLGKAAEIWLQLNDNERALKCYRSIPDFKAALALLQDMKGHPAQPSLEWLAEVNALFARRPDNFNRTMTPPEKKLLETTLEQGLGVGRKKPAAAKKLSAAAKQPRTTPKTTGTKRTSPIKRQPAKRPAPPAQTP